MKHSKSNICPYLHIQCDNKEKSGGKYGYKNIINICSLHNRDNDYRKNIYHTDKDNYQVNNKFYTRSDLAISDKSNRCYMGIAYRNQLDNSNYCWSTWNTWGSTTNDINNSFMKFTKSTRLYLYTILLIKFILLLLILLNFLVYQHLNLYLLKYNKIKVEEELQKE